MVALSACMAEMTEHTSAPDMECLDLLSYQSVAQALSALAVATMMVGFGPERGGEGRINSLAWSEATFSFCSSTRKVDAICL